MWPVLLASIGILLSVYALLVEHRARRPGYRALCDLHEHVSCSRAFTSEYAHLAGLPNGVYGIAFYIGVIATALLRPELLILLTVPALAATILLAALLVKIRNACVVCITTYTLNVVLFVISLG